MTGFYPPTIKVYKVRYEKEWGWCINTFLGELTLKEFAKFGPEAIRRVKISTYKEACNIAKGLNARFGVRK